MSELNLTATSYDEVDALIERLEGLPKAEVLALVNAGRAVQARTKPQALRMLRERLERRIDRSRPALHGDCMIG